jgi:hypothetical protein
MLSTTFWSAGPPIEVRFAVVTVSAIISAVFPGRDEEFLAVGRVAVAALDLGDLPVAVVVEIVGAARNGA